MLEHLESSGLCARLAAAHPDVPALVREAHRALWVAEEQLRAGAFDPLALAREVKRVEASLRHLWGRLRSGYENGSRPSLRAYGSVASS